MSAGQSPIRSFVVREGRFTPAQRRAFDRLWPQYGVDVPHSPGTLIDWQAHFPREQPLVMEIGFGAGEALVHAASTNPNQNFVGIEMHRPGIGRLLQAIDESELKNVVAMRADAVEVLAQNIADETLEGIRLFFPDPWPKKRHHKRRIVQPDFVNLCQRRLRQGGFLHFATDWAPYAQHMLEVLSSTTGLTNLDPGGGYHPRPDWRLETRFEARGLRLGHDVYDLIFKRV